MANGSCKKIGFWSLMSDWSMCQSEGAACTEKAGVMVCFSYCQQIA